MAEEILYCSFCAKSQEEVRALIKGPSVNICIECVDLCEDILEEHGYRRVDVTEQGEQA